MNKIFYILSIAMIITSCGQKQSTEQSQTAETTSAHSVVTLTDEQFKNAGIETEKLSMKNISSVIKLNGKIDVPPQSMVSVSVPLGGYLKSTKLINGMPVSKGEVLAVMEDVQYIQLQQEYLTAKSQFALMEKEYNRQRELNVSKATSDKNYEQAKANYQSQQILMKSLEEKLKLIGLNPQKLAVDNISKSINIYSPITGFVSAVNVNIGKYVTPGEMMFELVNPSDIHLVLTVFEKDVNKLSIGQKLFAYTNADPAKKYDCEILLISKNISNQSAAEVHCLFEQYDKSLLPGMFMNADIELTANNTSAITDEAIVRYENKHYVFIVRGDKQYEMMEVQLGNSENGFTEILEEDLKDKTFVTKGAYTLLMTLKNTSDE